MLHGPSQSGLPDDLSKVPDKKPVRESQKISLVTVEGDGYINSIVGGNERPRRRRRLGNDSGRPFGWLANHKWFARTVQCMILTNSLQMGLEVVFTGDDFRSPFMVCEHFFTVFFFTEMVIKIYCDGKRYFTDPDDCWWNLLDVIVVSVSVVDAWILTSIGVDGGGAAEGLKILRLARLLRVIKLLREYQALMLLIESIVGSLKPMGWLAAMLLILIYAFAIFCVQVVGRSDIYPEGRGPGENQEYPTGTENLTLLFGDLGVAMFALSGLALGHRAKEILKSLYYFQFWVLPLMYAYMMLVMFGVLNAMIGIVCQKTKEACQETERLEELAKQKSQKDVVDELKSIMYKMDVDGDGTVSQQELEKAGHNPMFQEMLTRVELPAGFRLVDVHLMLDKDGDGELTEDEFADGMYDLISGNSFQRQCILMRSVAQGKRAMCDFREEMLAEFTALRNSLGLRNACDSGSDSGAAQPQRHRRGSHAHEQKNAQVKSPRKFEPVQGNWEPLNDPDGIVEESLVVGQPVVDVEMPLKCAIVEPQGFQARLFFPEKEEVESFLGTPAMGLDCNQSDDPLDSSMKSMGSVNSTISTDSRPHSQSRRQVFSARVAAMQMAAAKYGGRGKSVEAASQQSGKRGLRAAPRAKRQAALDASPRPLAPGELPRSPRPTQRADFRRVAQASLVDDMQLDDVAEVTDVGDANYIGDTLGHATTALRPAAVTIRPPSSPPGMVQDGR